MSESDILHQFVNGLNPKPLRQAVRAENPKNLDTAIRKAIEIEEDEDDSFSDSNEGPACQDQDSENSSSDTEEKPPKSRKSRRKVTQPRDKTVGALAKQIEEMKIFMMKGIASNRKCFNCQNSGHEAAQCPKPCKLCKGMEGTKGHAFFECPIYKPKINARKNILVDGSINPKEEMDDAMAVKRGHETAIRIQG